MSYANPSLLSKVVKMNEIGNNNLLVTARVLDLRSRLFTTVEQYVRKKVA